jgi:hypothetical protein
MSDLPNFSGAQILNVPLPDNDADAPTVRAYLLALLRELWANDEGFDSKRPFGNSGWQEEVYIGLARAGVVEAEFDEDGYLDHCDYAAADVLIQDAIRAFGGTS